MSIRTVHPVSGEEIIYGGRPGQYNLPPATATTIGGVKPGTNISVASDGTISASVVINDDSTVLPGTLNAVLKKGAGANETVASTMIDDGDGVAFAGTTTVTGQSNLNGGAVTTTLTASGASTLQATSVTNLTVAGVVNGAPSNSLTYVAISVARVGLPTVLTNVTGAITGVTYVQFTSTYNGTSTVFVDRIQSNGTTNRYFGFVSETNRGTEIPRS